ncbi:MAG: glycosyltransferase [Ruminococcaceae bacterium]|nr:glycosyltransferase [Oscillospiraceae bacterium]
MKVLLYFEGIDKISRSGINKVLKYQQMALDSVGIEYTLDPDDDFDILHINTVFFNSEPIISKARKNGAAIVYNAHSIEDDFKNPSFITNMVSKVFQERLKGLYLKGDCIIAPTLYSCNTLQNYGIKTPIEVVPNAVDTNNYIRNSEKADNFRAVCGFDKNDKIVVSIGQTLKKKGFHDFLSIAKMLPEYKFVWIPSTKSSLFSLEIRNITLHDYPPNVILSDYVSEDDYIGALSAADVILYPTYEESEGINLLECMACKNNIVVRDLPVYQDWLKDGVNCYKGQNNDDFARIVKDLIEGKINDVSLDARKTAEEHSLKNVGIKLKRIYEATQEDVITTAIRKFAKDNNKNDKLHIGLFSDTYYPDVNGVSVSIETLRKQLQRMGHTVYVITATLDTKLVGGVEFESGVLRIPAVKLKQLYGYRISRPISIQALDYIKNMDLDIIHIHTEFTIRMIALAAARLYKIPYCYTSHTMWEDYTHYITKGHFDKTSRKLVGMYSKYVYDRDCEIIVPSQKTFEVLKTYGIKKQMHVVPTGIDTARLNPENVNREYVDGILDSLNIKDKFRIVYVGRLAQEKSLDLIIENLTDVFDEYPDTVMLITGYGPSEEDLKALVKQKGLTDKVFFMGKQPPDQIQNYYALGNLFVTASTSETQGLTYIEAMAAGLPVVARYDEVLTDVLVDNVTGLFFKTGKEFVSNISKYRNLPEEKQAEMRNNALKKAEEYSLETFGNKILKAYYRAIRKSTVKRATKHD